MMGGQVLTREAFIALCKKNKGPAKLIETFQNDQRGDNTVVIVLICESFFRQIWFGYTDREMENARARNKDVSELILFLRNSFDSTQQSADYWDEGLKDAIDAGDPSGIQRYLISAVGRYNTVIDDVPLPPFHPPA
ncbi:hypothetical protein HWV62_44187 [Athelia sp. TMB]|nr:hypothetical protein HWV62_44187 [Athelia sp. TMB]